MKELSRMRETKFRGKAVGENRWVYGDFINMMGKFPCIYGMVEGQFTATRVEPETVGQYTGIKDAAENDIYEGDILIEYPHKKYHEVIWDEYGLFLFNPVGTEGQAVDYYEFEQTAASTSFIQGNCFDNPELLEGDE